MVEGHKFYMLVKVKSVEGMIELLLHRPCETSHLLSLAVAFRENHLLWRYSQSRREKYNVNNRIVELLKCDYSFHSMVAVGFSFKNAHFSTLTLLRYCSNCGFI